ncbi:hypothetical protein V6N13_088322 [Hibiscus sabdariffa]
MTSTGLNAEKSIGHAPVMNCSSSNFELSGSCVNVSNTSNRCNVVESVLEVDASHTSVNTLDVSNCAVKDVEPTVVQNDTSTSVDTGNGRSASASTPTQTSVNVARGVLSISDQNSSGRMPITHDFELSEEVFLHQVEVTSSPQLSEGVLP